MTDDDVLIALRLALSDLPTTSPARPGLQRAIAELHQRALRSAELYFWLHPGFVQIGAGEPGPPLPIPPLPGIEHAWQILLRGAGAGKVLVASDLAGDQKRPSNALRNQLAAAADWIERTGGCPELAAELRSPRLVVHSDGALTYTPSGRRLSLR